MRCLHFNLTVYFGIVVQKFPSWIQHRIFLLTALFCLLLRNWMPLQLCKSCIENDICMNLFPVTWIVISKICNVSCNKRNTVPWDSVMGWNISQMLCLICPGKSLNITSFLPYTAFLWAYVIRLHFARGCLWHPWKRQETSKADVRNTFSFVVIQQHHQNFWNMVL